MTGKKQGMYRKNSKHKGSRQKVGGRKERYKYGKEVSSPAPQLLKLPLNGKIDRN